MKKMVFIFKGLLLFSSSSITFANQYVRGYYRSTPNSVKYDNYSTEGNVNPYAGKKGTKSLFDENLR